MLDRINMDAEVARAIAQTAGALKRARRVAAITGAGISAESGVPTFRGAGGLWRTFRAEDLATPEAFRRDPVLVWEWYWWRRGRIAAAQPNPGHLALARFENRFPAFTLLTQNVDGLHAQAGSRNLIELHGNIWRARCSAETARVFDQRGEPVPTVAESESQGRTFGPSDLRGSTSSPRPEPVEGRTSGLVLPTCPSCGALLRPDVVWFGEALDPEGVQQAVDAVQRCDVLLVVGTSAVVYPVAALPAMARRARATIVEVNVETTALTAEADIVLRGPSGEILPEVERLL